MRDVVIPDEFSFEEAATVPVNYLTAWLMLMELAHLQPANGPRRWPRSVLANFMSHRMPLVSARRPASGSSDEVIIRFCVKGHWTKTLHPSPGSRVFGSNVSTPDLSGAGPEFPEMSSSFRTAEIGVESSKCVEILFAIDPV